MKFLHIRNATSIITYADKKILIDPFLSPKGSLPSVPTKYNDYKNPLVELPFKKEEIIKGIDAVIVTHMHHFDHFDNSAAEILDKNIPIFTQNKSELLDMQKLGFQDVRVLEEEGTNFDDIYIYKTYAEHGRGKAAEDNYTQHNIPGEASGFVLKNENEKTIYFAGDTLLNKTVLSYIDKYSPEIIVLNAARAEFYDGTPILMGMEDLHFIQRYKPDASIIAVHLDAVNHATITREQLNAFVKKHNLSKNVFIPKDGEALSF